MDGMDYDSDKFKLNEMCWRLRFWSTAMWNSVGGSYIWWRGIFYQCNSWIKWKYPISFCATEDFSSGYERVGLINEWRNKPYTNNSDPELQTLTAHMSLILLVVIFSPWQLPDEKPSKTSKLRKLCVEGNNTKQMLHSPLLL